MNQLVPHKEESKMIYVIVGFALILLIAVLIIGVMCFVDYVDYCLCFLHSHKERSKQWYKTPTMIKVFIVIGGVTISGIILLFILFFSFLLGFVVLGG